MPTVQQSDVFLRSNGAVKMRSLERRLPSPLSWRCRPVWARAVDSRICRESMGDNRFSRSNTQDSSRLESRIARGMCGYQGAIMPFPGVNLCKIMQGKIVKFNKSGASDLRAIRQHSTAAFDLPTFHRESRGLASVDVDPRFEIVISNKSRPPA